MNQKMWAELKRYVLSKNSHGKNELLSAMVEIEIAAACDPVLTARKEPLGPFLNSEVGVYNGPG